jgi:hypothetical protein
VGKAMGFQHSLRITAACFFSPQIVVTRPGKHTENYGKSHFFMGKSTISMAIFKSYVCLPEG